MAHASTFSIGLFIAIVASVAGIFFSAARRASAAGLAISLGVLVTHIALPGALAYGHYLDRYAPLPAPVMILMGVIALITIVLAFSPFGGRLAASAPLAGLVGFQFFRVPLEWLLHRMAVEGVVPIQMTYAGLNFDVVAGITAALLGMYLLGGGRAPRVVFAWNVLGLLLLGNIGFIAIHSTPSPFRYFMNEPANTLPSMFPFVWLPAFLVQAALFGHIVTFRALARGEAPAAAAGHAAESRG